MLLKISRHEYKITGKDKFMDNGCCVQLLTQSKEKSSWGRIPSPVLSKRAIKIISQFERIQHKPKQKYMVDVQIFNLNI